jgi:alkylhydroperoxidase family enzyme
MLGNDRAPTMAWIRLPRIEDATGDLARLFREAITRAGRVWNIVRIMSPNPAVMESSMGFYKALMHGKSPLTRGQRELLATVVSREVGCLY